ncbi:hypothetical protein R5R73_01260 [Salinicola sp. LHM]|uniref:hypothetical protein n=1 Tax=Salinicola sp. LHM TaxID=3065298 RepID=UPI002ACE75FF|nr:hypothetical protein [Salinicola sp. LHM]WQH33355.1 hypothetical protein R5R73_01260 [Salinicola sp. LHM]
MALRLRLSKHGCVGSVETGNVSVSIFSEGVSDYSALAEIVADPEKTTDRQFTEAFLSQVCRRGQYELEAEKPDGGEVSETLIERLISDCLDKIVTIYLSANPWLADLQQSSEEIEQPVGSISIGGLRNLFAQYHEVISENHAAKFALVNDIGDLCQAAKINDIENIANSINGTSGPSWATDALTKMDIDRLGIDSAFSVRNAFDQADDILSKYSLEGLQSTVAEEAKRYLAEGVQTASAARIIEEEARLDALRSQIGGMQRATDQLDLDSITASVPDVPDYLKGNPFASLLKDEHFGENNYSNEFPKFDAFDTQLHAPLQIPRIEPSRTDEYLKSLLEKQDASHQRQDELIKVLSQTYQDQQAANAESAKVERRNRNFAIAGIILAALTLVATIGLGVAAL